MLKPEKNEYLDGVRSKRAGKALNESLNKRLTAYALAAGAAGVGVLALAPPAQASIIVDTTPISIGVNTKENLTINGKNVLSFSADNHFLGPSTILGALDVRVSTGAAFLNGPVGKSFKIGASVIAPKFTTFSGLAHNLIAPGTSLAAGPWANKTGYLGFKFESHGNSYFGWAHLSVKANPRNGESGVISSFAYDNVAGQAILAGEKPTPTAAEPGSLTLSLLALGAVGLFALRKKKLSAT